MLTSLSFFAASWKAQREAPPGSLNQLRQTYSRDLWSLHQSLPLRFHPVVEYCLNSLDAVLSLPTCLIHRDFSTANLILDETSCHLIGVLDWGEAEVGPFGQNIHFVQNLMCVLRHERGWIPLEDYETLQKTFWDTFQEEAGGLPAETITTIKIAGMIGLLLYRGFTRRLANMPQPVPISEDEAGRYSLLYLDAFLLNSATRIKT